MKLIRYKLYYPQEYYRVYFEGKRDLLDKKALDIICGGAEEIRKGILGIKSKAEYDFELLSLLKTANEAICKGVDLTGIV